MNPANKTTMLRILLVPVFVACFYMKGNFAHFIACIIFIFASLTDLWDGWYARKHNMVTDFGKLMDPMADKMLVLAALMVIMDMKRIEAWVVLIIIGREFLISAFRLVAATKGVVIQAGWSGKVKTIVQDVGAVVILLNASYFVLAGRIILYLSAALSVWSCAEYILKNKHVMTGELEMKEKKE